MRGEGNYAFDDYDYFSFGRGPGFNEPVASGTGVIGPDGLIIGLSGQQPPNALNPQVWQGTPR